MKDKLQEIFEKICPLRPDIPQLLFVAEIKPDTAIKVRKEIAKLKKDHPEVSEIDFIINSPGGLAHDAYRIIRNLRENFDTVNVIIPFWAKSAATLLSLGASNIFFDEFAEFGPLDAQIGTAREDGPSFDRESALNDEHSLSRIETRFKEMYESMYIRIYESDKINIPKTELSKQLMKHLAQFYEPLMEQINPYKLGEKRRILDIGGQYANRILAQFGTLKDKQVRRLFVDYLVNDCPDHGYVIDYHIASKFLSNAYTTKELGSEYSEAIAELSLLFMEQYEEYEIVDIFKPSNTQTNETQSLNQSFGENKTPTKKPIATKKEHQTTNEKTDNNGQQKNHRKVSTASTEGSSDTASQ